MTLKVFTVEYNETWNYGGYETIHTIAVANTESEVLGLVLEEYPDLPDNWCVEGVDMSKTGVEEIERTSS
tara:strand:+ start:433 stop:642 length:210 start_codon:yes stop_codon:yes gene_type:complete